MENGASHCPTADALAVAAASAPPRAAKSAAFPRRLCASSSSLIFSARRRIVQVPVRVVGRRETKQETASLKTTRLHSGGDILKHFPPVTIRRKAIFLPLSETEAAASESIAPFRGSRRQCRFSCLKDRARGGTSNRSDFSLSRF